MFFTDDFFDDLVNLSCGFEHYENSRFVFPLLNVYENKNSFFIQAELPGLDKNGIKVTLTGDTLSLEGSRKRSREGKKAYYRAERPCGSFKRSMTISNLITKTSIHAEMKDGILTIILPKSKNLQTKKVVIS